MVRKVFFRGKQYASIDDLKEAVLVGWEDISSEYTFKLYRSYFRLLIAVIDANGGETRYWELFFVGSMYAISLIVFLYSDLFSSTYL